MVSESLVNLSRLQFAATAMYHFLFVPLTLGMAWLLLVMESVYVMTGQVVWKDMTRFWGKLFGINFALGVTTGITLLIAPGSPISSRSVPYCRKGRATTSPPAPPATPAATRPSRPPRRQTSAATRGR